MEPLCLILKVLCSHDPLSSDKGQKARDRHQIPSLCDPCTAMSTRSLGGYSPLLFHLDLRNTRSDENNASKGRRSFPPASQEPDLDSAWVRCAGLQQSYPPEHQVCPVSELSAGLPCSHHLVHRALGHPRKMHPLTHVLAVLSRSSYRDVPAAVGSAVLPHAPLSQGRSLTKPLLISECSPCKPRPRETGSGRTQPCFWAHCL